MACSIVDLARSLHEENELIKKAIVDDFVNRKPRSHKGTIRQKHRLREALLRISKNNHRLEQIYADEDGSLREEVDALQADNVLTLFYDRVKEIREYYRKFPDASAFSRPRSAEEDGADAEEEDLHLVSFTGDEKFGKFIDLNEPFEQYLNLPMLTTRPEYIEYLKNFHRFSGIQANQKNDAFRKYLQVLLDTLANFHEKIHPLYPSTKIMRQIEEEFERTSGGKSFVPPLYCEPCQKSFSKQTVFENHLSGKKHMKKQKIFENNVANGTFVSMKQMAILEEKISVYRELLQSIIDATIRRAEAQQTRTFDEIDAERNEETDEEEEESEEEEEMVLYNPKNVPLGWDGKPIPYWLFKLHGLNIEYKCEICGDYSYWGPRAFERHFTEWRHVNGMKSLGIPNSQHFKNVTKIEDALTLHRKVEATEKARDWRPEEDEEFEDDQGNVFKKKTYDDLKRQGLL